ncbi:MAG TPA: hypothetical protein VN281_14890, partial [Verrucomicrobiae bacterium]|nr:hypothetical protein [Verrucomicrobiae bacterium]
MSLTQPQISLHWNNEHGWGRVCGVNNWRMEGGLLVPGAVGPDRSQWHERVWAYADMPSLLRFPAADRLRKGCYLFALGTLKSLTQFDNEDLDRVLNAFALLINPEDLRAVHDRLAYEKFDTVSRRIAEAKRLGIECDEKLPDHPGERRRHLAFLRTLSSTLSPTLSALL